MMNENTEIPKWLKKLQHNSWNAEILLSGLILFSLTRAPKALEQVFSRMVQEYGLAKGGYDNALVLIETGVIWLIIGFILHLTIRGAWIGLVGLSYIFPKGIQHEKLPYQPRYLRLITKKTDLISLAIRIDKVASGVFSIAFYFFMSIVGLTVLGFVLGAGSHYIIQSIFEGESYYKAQNFASLIIVLLFLIYSIDFLTLGGLKRIKWLQPIYYPIYRMMSLLMLAPFYRHIYYAFVSNFKKWKIVLGVLTYAILSIFIIFYMENTRESDDTTFSGIDFYARARGMNKFHGHYENLNEGNYSVRAHIQSDIITGNTIRLFVVHDAAFEDDIKKVCNYDETLTNSRRDSMGLACMDQFYRIYLGDSVYQHSPWLYHEKQATHQKGLTCWIDVTDLKKGQHKLQVRIARNQFNWVHAEIPFYKE